jgi:hypothetical protein
MKGRRGEKVTVPSPKRRCMIFLPENRTKVIMAPVIEVTRHWNKGEFLLGVAIHPTGNYMVLNDTMDPRKTWYSHLAGPTCTQEWLNRIYKEWMQEAFV